MIKIRIPIIKSGDELKDLGDTLNTLTRELRKNLVIKQLRDKAYFSEKEKEKEKKNNSDK
ncbi:hypothetical protein COZ22_00420 [bacterium (Candidatus Howlettbacteria) CG_4_10_14_3_um_filter_37_10]|nr:MAG: hypothetical protein COX25_03850 [bacterium (Candidatus Howlettbacteria) CG23_combo_of_CG06-09_8_20_14_all_37_9]PIY00381.1 MAG: hypothetical protein COZ22_00420 [bacterium (Candidatus Howlettbacteria) CG_4_10_14_3_um_filter_37_10]